ncbi:glycosyltransferase family 2 protein [Mangrovicoccus sp. HB161399]|uniref:glycosyltransferase family 2 protein n=1 Tax=Mangrovicoccus sp. HB161399 TaxID=2720392 RepID=UPI0015561DC1|nr:glycosyltransferase family 2 protein [Mangrovicoccus sp. HB161399]
MTKTACVTMMKDEDFFLPIWFRYYSRLFGAENLFILDHCSSRSPAEMLPGELGAGCVKSFRIPSLESLSEARSAGRFDAKRFELISSLLTGLLAFYDVVIFNDADEIYVPDPARYPDLRAYVEARGTDNQITAGLGMEMFHDVASEAAFDPAQPIFAQRRSFFCSLLYTKPHMLGTGSRIWPHAAEKPFVFDPDLHLVHMKFIDADRFLSRQEERRAFRTSVAKNTGKLWLWDGDRALEELRRYNEMPLDGTPFSGRDVMQRLFGRSEPVRIGGMMGPERKRTKKLDRYRVIDYVTPARDKRLASERRVIPERFVQTGI